MNALTPAVGLGGAGIAIMQSLGPRQTKLIRRNGLVEPAEPARVFNALELPIKDLDALEGLLRGVLCHPQRFIIRGALVGGAGPLRGINRRSRPGPGGEAPTIRDVARPWIAVDLDDVPIPPEVKTSDLAACGTLATALLPAEFHGVQCAVQASGSHGIKPGARLRLWYWLNRSITTAEAKVWLKGSRCDPSIYSPEHQVYVAPPVREDGGPDHLPCRLIRLPGRDAVPVPPIKIPVRATVDTAVQPTFTPDDSELAAIKSIIRVLPNNASRSAFLAFGHAVADTFSSDLECGKSVWLEWVSRRDGGPTVLGADEATWDSIASGPHENKLDMILSMARQANIDPRAHGYFGQGYERAEDEFEATEATELAAPAGGMASVVDLLDDPALMPAAALPELMVRRHNLPATADDLGHVLSRSARLYERAGGGAVAISLDQDGMPAVQRLSIEAVQHEAHRLSVPVAPDAKGVLRNVTLPEQVAKIWLAVPSCRQLRVFAGVSAAPLLDDAGGIRTPAGWDGATELWCRSQPALRVSSEPTQTRPRSRSSYSATLSRASASQMPLRSPIRRVLNAWISGIRRHRMNRLPLLGS